MKVLKTSFEGNTLLRNSKLSTKLTIKPHPSTFSVKLTDNTANYYTFLSDFSDNNEVNVAKY